MSRAEEILKRLSREEKIAQLQCVMSIGGGFDESACPDGVGEFALMGVPGGPLEIARAIQSLTAGFREKGKLPPILHAETLTGLSAPGATVFPSAIGLGASFDPALVERIAAVIHEEMLSLGYRQALAPVLDVCRDPRWGRVGETYGEDPTLSAMIGTAYVKGLQGPENDPAAATAKHFLGYGMSSGGLNMATCTIPPRELREVYAKPFQAAITEAGLRSVMNSYGTIDGEMVIGSKHILTDLLRGEMEFQGAVVSDYGSIEHLCDHGLAESLEEAGRMALQAGLDVECPQPVGYRTDRLLKALQDGHLDMDTIDRAALRVLELKEALGLLDGSAGPDMTRLAGYGSEQSFQISLEAARKSIVLLKNNGVLPLNKGKKTVAVIGPHADSVRLLFGGYTMAAGIDMMIGGSLADQAGMESGVQDLGESFKLRQDAPRYPGSTVERDNPAAMQTVQAAYSNTKTILSSLRERAPEIDFRYARGCDLAGTDRSGFAEALKLAEEADVVIMTAGGKYGWGGSCTVGEGIDTDDIGLTGVQEELALALAETGTPLILVHMDARPLSSPALAEKAAAILEIWFPGTTGGLALSETLFGDYNPAGRLSLTAARGTGQIPVYHSQYKGNSTASRLTLSSSCRYVDSTLNPLWCFGHGLSYTAFAYSDLRIAEQAIPADGSVTISCRVKNVGERSGEEVVQLYVTDNCASMLRPAMEFAGCARMALKAGEEKTVSFTLRADQFAFVGKDGRWIAEAGDMTVRIGAASDDIRLEGGFRITNTLSVRPAKRGFYAETKIIEGEQS